MIAKSCFIALVLLAFYTPLQADPSSSNSTEETKTELPSFNQSAASSNKPSYEEWLQNYQVWDKLDEQLAESDPTEDSILKQAQIAMQAGKPRHVLEILESTPPI